MSWSNDYVGIPFQDVGRTREGCDCWGLARLVYANELEIDLPSFADAYDSTSDQDRLSDLLANRTAHPWWRVLPEQRAPFDLLLFREGRHDTHIGIVIEPRTMLHMARGDHAKIEAPTSPVWSSRFVAAYRHVLSPSCMPQEVAS